MARNLEIKFRCADLATIRDRAMAADARDDGVLEQADTFFACPNGRLKLREFGDGTGELIWYIRADLATSRASDYLLSPASDPSSLKAALTQGLGTRGVVRKRRHLLMWRNVRIHLDQVEGLGSFVELESVVGDVDEATANANLERVVRFLGLDPSSQAVAVAYADLLHL